MENSKQTPTPTPTPSPPPNGIYNGNRKFSRGASVMWNTKFDHFQVFEVDHKACWHLKIDVIRGENITKGFIGDIVDTPDPYVELHIPGSSNPYKETSHIDNSVCPLWEETFHFYIDPAKVQRDPMGVDSNKPDLKLIVLLKDANYLVDENLGSESLLISSLVENEEMDHIFTFVNGSKVHTKILLQKNKNHDLRFSLTLCDQETAALRIRREKVQIALNNLLGKRGPQDKDEVPIVAVLGSGGGFRAMICFSGVIQALHKSGILKCAMFLSGLSGSSWLISTLYAHDKFPYLTCDDLYQELKESVTRGWKSKLVHSVGYAQDMITKCRGGQPVSFTDFFGHLLGDVLLKGKKEKKLSEQQGIVSQGLAPFPLYTCIHAKASVSCQSFSEWVEFSPFEIGIAKYGTFMKTEDFGNKFIVGKIIRKFPEFPLHYLQGVWGSAFTVLMKQILNKRRVSMDIVQMMRYSNKERALNEKEQLKQLANDILKDSEQLESDTDDEGDIEAFFDTNSSSEEKEQSTKNGPHIEVSGQHQINGAPANTKYAMGTAVVSTICKKVGKLFTKGKQSEEKKASIGPIKKEPSVINKPLCETKSRSLDETEFPNYSPPKAEERRMIPQSNSEIGGIRNPLKRQEAVPNQDRSSSEPPNNQVAERRKQPQPQRESKCSWIRSFLETSNILNLSSRAGRAGEIFNPFRGLSIKYALPLSPFTQVSEDHDNPNKINIGEACRYESLDKDAKKLFIVDSGLAFNSPYPLLLRPQRAVDIFLSFDFSQREKDVSMPFEELIIAEEWAIQNKVRFPPIKELAEEFSKDPEVKEVYVFEDPKDLLCPVVLHFPLVNNNFKKFKEPGVQRETKEEFDFANFPIFDCENQCFASTNFLYDELQYDRLVKLMEFNTNNCLDTIKENLIKVIEKKSEANKLYTRSSVDTLRMVLKAKSMFKAQYGLKVNTKKAERFINVRPTLLKTRTDSGNFTADEECRKVLDHAIEGESEEEPFYTPPVHVDDMNKFGWKPCNGVPSSNPDKDSV